MALEFPSNPTNGQVYGQYTYDGSYKVWRSTPDLASGLPAGTILQWGTNTPPANWLICDGSAISRTTYASLYAAIGLNFGAGDGATTFNLPDLRGRVPIGRDVNQTEFDVLGETGGNKATAKYGDGTVTGFGTVYTDSLGTKGDATSSNLPPYQVVNYIIKISASVTSSDSDLASRVGILENKFNTGQNDAPAGAIIQWAAAAAPTNWLLCDGSAVSRATWPSLFAAIGITYGAGDGTTTFNLPNLKGKVAVGLDASQTEFAALAQTGGAKTHTLTTAEMPVHSHGVTDPSHSHVLRGPVWRESGYNVTLGSGVSGASVDQGATTSTATTGISINNAGSGSAHNNLQPYIVLNYIIKATAGVSTNDSTFVSRIGAVETRASNLEINSPNYLMNAGMDIWQRGTSVVLSSTQPHGADRWRYGHSRYGASANVTISQQTFTPGAAPVLGLQSYMRTTFTDYNYAGDYAEISQRIENVYLLAGKTITISFWANFPSAGQSVSLVAYVGGVSGGTGTTGTVTVSSVIGWNRYTATMTLSNLSGATITAGSNYTAIGIRYYGVAGSSTTFDMTAAQVEEGTAVTPFRRNAENISAELAACQRYFFPVYSTSADIQKPLQRYSTTGAIMTVTLPVPMRANPTLTSSNSGRFVTYGTDFGVSVASVTGLALGTAGIVPNEVEINVTHGVIAGTGVHSSFDTFGITGPYLYLTAEL